MAGQLAPDDPHRLRVAAVDVHTRARALQARVIDVQAVGEALRARIEQRLVDAEMRFSLLRAARAHHQQVEEFLQANRVSTSSTLT